MVDSNKEHGEGRSNVVIYDSMNARVAIFEAKYTKVLENLGSACDTALRQLMIECTQRSMRKTMTRFFATVFRFLKSVAW